MTNQAKAPAHLSRSMRAWFRQVLDVYELGPHHVKLLTLGCEAFDRATEAREIIAAAGGPTYLDRFGAPRVHPAVSVERDARLAFVRIVRELCLDDDAPEAPRPQRAG